MHAPFFLFLDFDGVLHSAGAKPNLFEHADRLGEALTPYPEVQVVISSSWREVHPIDELRDFCGSVLGNRLVGALPVFRRHPEPIKPRLRLRSGGHAPLWKRAIHEPWYERFEEISCWLKLCASATSHPHLTRLDRQDWAALDDMASWFPPGCPQLIHVAGGGGLDDHHIQQLETLLLAHRSRRAPSRALFLDFDGCLHASSLDAPATNCVPFTWLNVLVELLAGHPDVGLVVHSTWRYTHEHAEIRALLGPLGPQFLSTTPRGPRQESILWWLQMHAHVVDYRVIDDDPREFDDELEAKLILCPPLDGIRDAQVQRRIRDWLGAPKTMEVLPGIMN